MRERKGGREGGKEGGGREGGREGEGGGREGGGEGGREKEEEREKAHSIHVYMYMYLYTCTSPPVRLCSYPDILVALLQLHTHSSLCHDLLCRETPALYDDSVLDVF